MNATEEVQLDNLSIDDLETAVSARVTFVCFGIVSAVSCSLAVFVLRKAKRIPSTAKYLSSALMVFDFAFILTSMIRKFIDEPIYNTTMHSISNSFLQLAFMTIGLMSSERFFVFYRPMLYVRIFKKKLVRNVSAISWTITVGTFLFVRYGACYLKHKTFDVFAKPGICNSIVTIHYLVVVASVLCTSVMCYCYIFRIVKMQATPDGRMPSLYSAATMLRSYRSTSLVLVFLFVTFCSSIAYATLLISIRHANLKTKDIRLLLDIISITNCILDPFLYVMWFKESQMILLDLFSCFNESLKKTAEEMKYSVYNIAVSENNTNIVMDPN